MRVLPDASGKKERTKSEVTSLPLCFLKSFNLQYTGVMRPEAHHLTLVSVSEN